MKFNTAEEFREGKIKEEMEYAMREYSDEYLTGSGSGGSGSDQPVDDNGGGGAGGNTGGGGD